MRFDEEIVKAVKHQAATDTNATKTEDEILAIEETVRTAVSLTNYDFSKSKSSVVSKDGGKKRFVKKFSDNYSVESVLCQCIKQILDRTFRIKYPNRNKSIRALFDALKAVKQMADFTIVKYDFKDYFNSVSAPYVYEKYLKAKLTNRFEADLISHFVGETKYTYAGFCTSNVIAEIIAKQFDTAVRLAFADKGVLLFERYIDDSVIIFNEHIEKSECEHILKKTLSRIFHDNSITVSPKCKTRFNKLKSIHISHRGLSTVPNTQTTFDYLGYEFSFEMNNDRIEIKYGITQEKQDKYKGRIDEIISLYKEPTKKNGLTNPDFHNMELLRQRIVAFTSRTVYQSRRYRATIWKAKGFVGNYGELRYLLDTTQIDNTTKAFLENMVVDAFNRASLPYPYFLKGANGKRGYSLFENMKRNKTLLLVDRIGYSKPALERLCSKVGISLIDKNGKERGYGNLVRDYLIELNVGY